MPDIEQIIQIWLLLTRLVPHGWAVAAVLVFIAASLVTNCCTTPPKPTIISSCTAWAKWLSYCLCERIALVGRGAKQRPDLAVKAIALANELQKGNLQLNHLLDLADRLRR